MTARGSRETRSVRSAGRRPRSPGLDGPGLLYDCVIDCLEWYSGTPHEQQAALRRLYSYSS